MGNTLLPAGPVGNGTAEKDNDRRHGKQPSERSRRGKLVWAVTVGLAFGAGWVVAGKSGSQRAREELGPDTGASQGDPAVVVVTVEPVTYRPVQRAVEGVGTLHGFEEITISARVEGRVQKIGFDVADRLEPGELLLQIEP